MLRVMHRGYKSERYRRKIEVFREVVTDGTLSTDIIVGHPGETEEDHEATLRLVEDCAFDSAYVFKFSPRSGTEAADMDAPVPPDDVTQRRFAQILGKIERNAFTANQSKVGGIESVYVRHGDAGRGRVIGETWSGHSVHLRMGPGREAHPGEYVAARVNSAGPHALYATPLGTSVSDPSDID
jgi:tRNA-2-methylthio-N6-dimethylallyladenosine synthase